jgi:hypothetical protein
LEAFSEEMSESGLEILVKFGEISAHFCSEKMVTAHFFLVTKILGFEKAHFCGQKPTFCPLFEIKNGHKIDEKINIFVKKSAFY